MNILGADDATGSDALDFDQEDVTLKNLEGSGALETAERWVENRKMIRMLETLRTYLTGRPRVFVDSVLNRYEKGNSGSATNLASVGVRVGSRNARQFQRYGASDEDTDDSDAENERARTAHKLFADETDLEVHSGRYSSSQSLDDEVMLPLPDGQGRKSSVSPDRGRPYKLLTPVLSPVRPMMASRNEGKKRQIDHNRFVLSQRPYPLELNSPIQLSSPSPHYPAVFTEPDTYDQRASGSHHTPEPLVDLHNFLEKRPLLSTSPRRSTSNNSPQGSRKRRRLRKSSENTATKKTRDLPNSPAYGVSTNGPHERPLKVAPIVGPSLATVNRGYPRSHVPLLSPITLTPRLPPHSRDSLPIHFIESSPASSKTASTSSSLSIQTERLRIADKLSRARPDLVIPSYTSKRARQLSWCLKSETREQYLSGLRSISHSHSASSSKRSSAYDSLPMEDVSDDSMDWNRSRLLKEMVTAQLKGGQQVALPLLACLDSQSK